MPVRAAPVVADLDHEHLVVVAQGDPDALGLAVAQGVRQRLLHQAQHRQGALVVRDGERVRHVDVDDGAGQVGDHRAEQSDDVDLVRAQVADHPAHVGEQEPGDGAGALDRGFARGRRPRDRRPPGGGTGR
jgi:hypothetical protein